MTFTCWISDRTKPTDVTHKNHLSEKLLFTHQSEKKVFNWNEHTHPFNICICEMILQWVIKNYDHLMSIWIIIYSSNRKICICLAFTYFSWESFCFSPQERDFHSKSIVKCVRCHRRNMKFIPKKRRWKKWKKLPSLLAKQTCTVRYTYWFILMSKICNGSLSIPDILFAKVFG